MENNNTNKKFDNLNILLSGVCRRGRSLQNCYGLKLRYSIYELGRSSSNDTKTFFKPFKCYDKILFTLYDMISNTCR